MYDKNITPRKAMGAAALTCVKGQGASSIDFLFYYKPETNGKAYVIMTRPENYSSYDKLIITMTGSGYSQSKTGNSMDSYLHKLLFTGLTTGKTYTIRFGLYRGDTETDYIEITRTYYCNNITPSDNPYYSPSEYKTIVPSYSSSYPKYCIEVECSENSSNVDGRCPYDATTRNLFWQVCATNYETHPISSAMEFQNTCRWSPGTVYVSVNYISTVNKSAISARINEWITWINGLVKSAGVKFQLGSTSAKNGKQISVIVGTHQQLFGYNPDNSDVETMIYGGTWETRWWGDGIMESQVKICCESRYPFNFCTPAFEGIVFEELTEASGPRYDQFGLNNTIFTEIAYPGKTVGGPPGESRTRDENVIKILYSLGRLKGIVSEKYEYDSDYGSGIHFTQYYNSYGALSSSSYDLFFQINASQGSITGYNGYTLPDSLYPTYKNKRNYSMRTIYATEVATSQKEQQSGLSFRYTNPSAEGTPYFALPNNPSFNSSTRVDKGFRINVSGLNTSGEYYYYRAYLKDATDADLDDYTYYESTSGYYSASQMSLRNLKYGRPYDFYLYSRYSGAESDWLYIGSGTVAPKKPELSNVSNTDESVTFTYDMGDTVFDTVHYKLYKNGTLISSQSSSSSSRTVTLSFEKQDGNYTLEVYSTITVNGTTIRCVDYYGNETNSSYSFTIKNRSYFYWSDYTDQVKKGGKVTAVSYQTWNAFIQNIYDTICVYSNINGTIPTNSSYASGFGLAAGTSYKTALTDYGKMSVNNCELTAERFNIANYVISQAVSTGISYKYNKATSPTKVYASDLVALQNKLNSI